MAEVIAKCVWCDFKVPWGDFIGSALMNEHQKHEHRTEVSAATTTTGEPADG